MVRRAARRAPRLLPPGRGWPRRLQRWLRAFVVTLAVAGLTPLAEAVEQVLAAPCAVEVSGPGCEGDCDAGCEAAACHGTSHHCGCCAPAPPLAPPLARQPAAPRGDRDGPRPLPLLGPPDRAPPPPWQPPRV